MLACSDNPALLSMAGPHKYAWPGPTNVHGPVPQMYMAGSYKCACPGGAAARWQYAIRRGTCCRPAQCAARLQVQAVQDFDEYVKLSGALILPPCLLQAWRACGARRCRATM